MIDVEAAEAEVWFVSCTVSFHSILANIFPLVLVKIRIKPIGFSNFEILFALLTLFYDRALVIVGSMAVIETAFLLSGVTSAPGEEDGGAAPENHPEEYSSFISSYGEKNGHLLFLQVVKEPKGSIHDERPLVATFSRKVHIYKHNSSSVLSHGNAPFSLRPPQLLDVEAPMSPK
jgi:hypothetical protein